MNIVQAHKYYWHRDGASNYMLQLSGLLEEQGYTVIPFAVYEKDKTLDSPYQTYFVESLDLSDPTGVSLSQKIKTIARMFYSVHAEKQMMQLLNDYPVDIAHIHNIYHHISPSILKALKKKGTPIVMTLHDYKLIAPNYTLFHHGAVHEENAEGWYLSNIWQQSMKDSFLQSSIVTAEMILHHKMMKYYERFVDHFISPSQFLIDTCVRHGWEASRFSHIPNIVLPDQLQPVSGGGEYVSYLGRLSSEKGIETLVEAAAYCPDIPIKIAGHGPLEEILHRTVTEKKLSNIEFVGFLQGNDLSDFIKRSCITVVPSIWYENNPLSILESCAAGNIVIGSAIGGIPEMLPPDLLFEPHNAQDLAEKITLWYTATMDERKEKGRSLQERVQKNNDPVQHLDQIMQVYDQVR